MSRFGCPFFSLLWTFLLINCEKMLREVSLIVFECSFKNGKIPSKIINCFSADLKENGKSNLKS